MKARAASVLLTLLAPIAANAAQPGPPRLDPNSLIDHAPPTDGGFDLSGAWQVRGHLEGEGGTVAQAAPLCDFTQRLGQISGACKGPNSQGAASGTVAGRHVAWQWQAVAYTQGGVSGTARFAGDLGQDGVIRGTWTFSEIPGASGEFTQARP